MKVVRVREKDENARLKSNSRSDNTSADAHTGVSGAPTDDCHGLNKGIRLFCVIRYHQWYSY